MIAAQIGASEGWLRQLEKGTIKEPRVARMLAVARLFDVPLDWLADDGLDWPPPKSEKDQALELVGQALTGVGLAGELSDAERDVLACWRRLDPERQAEVRGYLRGMTTDRS